MRIGCIAELSHRRGVLSRWHRRRHGGCHGGFGRTWRAGRRRVTKDSRAATPSPTSGSYGLFRAGAGGVLAGSLASCQHDLPRDFPLSVADSGKTNRSPSWNGVTQAPSFASCPFGYTDFSSFVSATGALRLSRSIQKPHRSGRSTRRRTVSASGCRSMRCSRGYTHRATAKQAPGSDPRLREGRRSGGAQAQSHGAGVAGYASA